MKVVQNIASCMLCFLSYLVISVSSSNQDNDVNELVVRDLKLIAASSIELDISKDASVACWMHAMDKLEFQFNTNEEHNTQVKLSPGGDFCAAVKSGNYLDALAFELTKCEYERFSDPLPTNCSFRHSMHSGTSETDLRNCMSSLSKETWLGIWTAFTQYKLTSYNLCTKLTDEIKLYRQKEATRYLEKTLMTMEDKMDSVLQKADVHLEETVRDMKDDMQNLLNLEMENVQIFHEEIKNVLHKADDKLEETSKQMENEIQKLITNGLTEFYEQSGMQRVSDFVSKINNGTLFYSAWWANFIILRRLMMNVLLIFLFTSIKRIRRARLILILLVFFELVIEFNLNHLATLGHIDASRRNDIVYSLKYNTRLLCFIIAIVTFFVSFVTTDETLPTNGLKENCNLQINNTLEAMRLQIEMDKKARQIEGEEWKQSVLLKLEKEQREEKLRMSYRYDYSTPVLHPATLSRQYHQNGFIPSACWQDTAKQLYFDDNNMKYAPNMTRREMISSLPPKDVEELSEYDTCCEESTTTTSSSTPAMKAIQKVVEEEDTLNNRKDFKATANQSRRKRKIYVYNEENDIIENERNLNDSPSKKQKRYES